MKLKHSIKPKGRLKMNTNVESLREVVALLEPPIPEAGISGAIIQIEDSPSHDAIAVLAYSYWEARGRQGGSAEEDWFQAERELREQKAAEPAEAES